MEIRQDNISTGLTLLLNFVLVFVLVLFGLSFGMMKKTKNDVDRSWQELALACEERTGEVHVLVEYMRKNLIPNPRVLKEVSSVLARAEETKFKEMTENPLVIENFQITHNDFSVAISNLVKYLEKTSQNNNSYVVILGSLEKNKTKIKLLLKQYNKHATKYNESIFYKFFKNILNLKKYELLIEE